MHATSILIIKYFEARYDNDKQKKYYSSDVFRKPAAVGKWAGFKK